MKRLGIIGGLGVGTTAKFYLEIEKHFLQNGAKCTPPVIIGSVSAPLSVYYNCIVKNQCKFLPYLIDEAKRLEKAGADFLVMPCNTLHRYIEEIRSSVKIPVLSIVEETAKILKTKKEKIGFVSTLGTVKNKVYQNQLVANNISCLHITPAQQTKLNSIIRNLVNAQFCEQDKNTLISIIKTLKKRGAKILVLACTDLQLLNPSIEGIEIIDTMKLLAIACANRMLK
ncbi:MAG: amino acid racemase [Firmicutes bacterium]|nr:amino acid racemase [Bacillota bacterium]